MREGGLKERQGYSSWSAEARAMSAPTVSRIASPAPTRLPVDPPATYLGHLLLLRGGFVAKL
jgi:hypothetical protein